MRIPDLPRHRSGGRSGNRRRNALLAAAAAVVFLLLFGSGIASFYTDYLWYQDLGITQVFTRVLRTKLLLFAVFLVGGFLLLWGNLRIGERVRPKAPRRGPEDEVVQRYREAIGGQAGKVRLAVATVLSFLLAAGVGGRWEDFLLFRNQVPFGTKDPQFHRDVSFYVFDLPFRTFVVNWLLFALILTTLVTTAFHYLNGGIRLQVAQQRGATPQVKAHISVLLASIAFLKAYSYWLERFELLYSRRGFAQGAFYTDVKARLPALGLLTLISVAAGVLLLANIYRRGFALPAVSVGLWLLVTVLVGSALPAVTQQFKVKPAENRLELPYIQRNIEATRAAFGLTDVDIRDFDYTEAPGAISGQALQDDAATIRNIRLWDPNKQIAATTWQQQQTFKPYYQVIDTDVDRYPMGPGGAPTQVVLATREVKADARSLPQDNWVNRHLAYTHGYGAIVAPANATSAGGFPEYSLKDLPPTGEPALGPKDDKDTGPKGEPRIFVGEAGDASGVDDYAIVKTKQPEVDFQDKNGVDQTSSYDGQTGVKVGSALRRLAFAIRYRDVNIMTSPLITGASKLLYVRGVKERVRKVAPFLTLDEDPYPVITPDRRIMWVVDAYTTTTRYPYSESVGSNGNLAGVNYVKNSVKAVVDAYNGTVKLYVVDTKDPLLKAYNKTFPGLLTYPDRLSGPALKEYQNVQPHFRYPEDIFRLQANLLSRYHITSPRDFFSAADRWNVSPDPGVLVSSGGSSSTENTGAPVAGAADPLGLRTLPSGPDDRIPPTYQLQKLPEKEKAQEKERFVLTVPFVPYDAKNERLQLTAFLTARSDPDDYGKLVLYRMQSGQPILGPSLVASKILADTEISKEISLLNTQGSKVSFGNILLVPIDRSIVYVRPLYTQATKDPVPQLVKVIAVYGAHAVMKDTLKDALAELFPGAPPTLEQRNATPVPPGGSPSTTAPPPGGVPAPPALADLIARANTAFADAQAALQKGDLGLYQSKINEAKDAIAQAAKAGGATVPAAGTPTTTAPGATTTTTGSAGASSTTVTG